MLDYYRTQSSITDSGQCGELFDALPDSPVKMIENPEIILL
jgi:hypothetical protein